MRFMDASVDELDVADPASAWERAGFTVDPVGELETVRVGRVRIRLVGRDLGAGVVGWSLRDVPAGDVDGIPTRRSHAAAATPAEHANGVTAIDHLVLFSPDLARTVEALAAIGARPRRERDAELGGRPIRQIFSGSVR